MEPNELNQTSEENEVQASANETQDTEKKEGLAETMIPEQPAKPKKPFWKEVREWVTSIVAAVAIVLIIQNFLFTMIKVDGHSMDSTLADGERLFVTVADVKFGTVDRNDVVICHYPNRGNTYFVKRVVAVPGDQVYRKNGVTHVIYETTDENGNTATVDEPLDEEYILYYNPDNDYEAYTLADDEYFVVGDNRGNSHDSRDWNDDDDSKDVGPITKNMLVGHVRYVIWPFSNIRTVE